MYIILILITIISIIIAIYCVNSKKKIDMATMLRNDAIKQEHVKLLEEKDKLIEDNNIYLVSNKQLETKIEDREKYLKDLQNIISNTKEMSEKALEEYAENLDNKYKEKEKEYESLSFTLEDAYSNKQMSLLAEIDSVQEDLDKIKATRTAAIEANLREKEIENNLTFYCLDITDADKDDIMKLNRLKLSLNKPRVLSMLIWQTWFQKPLKALANNIVGVNDKTGIYKITNITTKECYIGQAVNIKDRWNEHVKCGLGIDTPAGNKLYKAMEDYGVWNFSFEVLEECTRDLLNEKEKYYIDLYNSYNFGYNSNKGIGK